MRAREWVLGLQTKGLNDYRRDRGSEVWSLVSRFLKRHSPLYLFSALGLN